MMALLNRFLSYTATSTKKRSYVVTALGVCSPILNASHLNCVTFRNYRRIWNLPAKGRRGAVIVQRDLSHTTINSRATTTPQEETGKEEEEPSKEKHESDLLPYASIPGPKPIPILGNKLLFTPIGGYPMEKFWSTCWKLYHEYGPIVKVSKVTSKLDIVFIFRPEDTRQLFQNEGPLPIRPPLHVLEYYRKNRPQWFTSLGLVPGNGPEWRRLRSSVQVLLKREAIVSKYRQKQASVAHDFVALIQHQYPSSSSSSCEANNSFEVQDLLPLLFRYTLEAVGVVSLGTRLGCLAIDEGEPLGRSHSIISANEDTLAVMGEALFKFPLYTIFPTKSFLRLAHAQDVIARLVEEQLTRHRKSRLADGVEFSHEHPFLAALMDQPDLTQSDIFLLLVEVFQGGIDATATTIAFCIHYLSRDDQVQSLLYQEVKDIDITTHNLQGLRYLRAVLQETFRLRPSASANSRILQKDSVFSRYQVPAGTLVSAPPVIGCHNEEVFPDAAQYQPERWLSRQKSKGSPAAPPSIGVVDVNAKQQETSKRVHPYTVLPFGHGARMCPGRRIAEQEIFLLLIQLVKTFKMEQIPPGAKDEVGQVMRMNMMPEAPISVKFTPRL